MVMCFIHNMFFSGKMRIYVITHIDFNNLFADTLHNHGGLTNGHKKGGVIIMFTPKVEALEKPIGTNEQTTTPPVYDM